MSKGEPHWGIYYTDDTYPATYPMSYEQALIEIHEHGDAVALMVLRDDEWTEVIYD